MLCVIIDIKLKRKNELVSDGLGTGIDGPIDDHALVDKYNESLKFNINPKKSNRFAPVRRKKIFMTN